MATTKKKAVTNIKFSDEELKHLEFIQGVINRMASNSFQMKGWMITIVSALLAIYADKKEPTYLIVAVIPTLLFWGLDSYYLWQERKFRGVYEKAARLREEPKEMGLFAMRPDLFVGEKYSFWKVVTSETILPLYVTMLALLAVLAAIYLLFK